MTGAAILKLLQARKEQAMQARDIIQIVGGSARQLRMEVQEMRKQGIPIISGDFGYMYSEDPRKIEQCMARLMSTANNIVASVDRLKTTKKRIERGEEPDYGPLFNS
jgi:hypothetical protein